MDKRKMSLGTRTYLHLGIAIILFILVKVLLKPTDVLTVAGVNTIAVFIPLAYLWIAVDIVWPSILSCVALIMLNVFSATDAWYNQLGHYSCQLVISLSLVCISLTETGVMRWIARYILSRKWLHGKPYLFIFMFGIVTLLVSAFAGVMTGAMIMIALSKDLRDQIGYTKNDKFSLAMCMQIMWLSPIADIVMPYGKLVPILGAKLMVARGINVTLLDFTKVGWIYALIAAVLGTFIIKFILRPDTGRFNDYDAEQIRRDLMSNPMTKRGKWALVMIILFLALQMIPEFNIPYISAWLSNLGAGTCGFIVPILGNLIIIEGKPVIKISDNLKKVNWGLFFFIGSIFLITGAFTNSDFGIMTFIAQKLYPIAKSMSPYVLMGIGFAISVLLTNLASNALVVVVVIGAFYSILMNAGLSNGILIGFGIIVVQAAMSAFATASGSSGSAVIFGDPDTGATVGNCFKCNIVAMLVLILVCIFVMLPLCGLILG